MQTSIAATASGSGNTPEANIITVGALTARSAAFFICQNYNIMSNEEYFKKSEEQKAAHMLMTEFVKNNADLVAKALQPIVAIWGEVTYESLNNDLGVVGRAFAGIALEVIEHNSCLEIDDPDLMALPVGARAMSNTVNSLSKFILSTRELWVLLINKHINDPAMQMAHKAFCKYEAQM